jgi:hypothetical protein
VRGPIVKGRSHWNLVADETTISALFCGGTTVSAFSSAGRIPRCEPAFLFQSATSASGSDGR